MTYETLASFAQTFGLVFFVVMFLIVLVYALRPSSRQKFKDAANIPLKED